MVKRKDVKEAHELAVIDDFLEWYNAEYDADFELKSRPEPPDAVIIDYDSDETTWVEICDAFYSADWAHDQFSHATEGEDDFDMKPEHGVYMDMDKQAALIFVNEAKKKLNKSSYGDVSEEYGPGILVIIVDSPWFNDQTVAEMESAWSEDEVGDGAGYFDTMFIGWRTQNGFDFQKWDLFQ